MLTSDGPVCDRCHAAMEAKAAEKRGFGVPGLDQDSPGKMMIKGAAIFAFGVAGTLLLLAFPPRYVGTYSFLPLFLILPGFAMFARGLHLRPRRRR
jgi:hypothetical protein